MAASIWKLNLRAYSISIPFGEVRISPTPLPWALAAPSTDNLQMGRLGASWVASVDYTGVNSMMKSTKILPFYHCPRFVPNVKFTKLYSPLYQPSRGFWFMQYLLHWIFDWDFDCMTLEVRSEFSGCGYQRQDQFFHIWVPLLCSPQSSTAIVDWLLHLVSFSYQGSTSCIV